MLCTFEQISDRTEQGTAHFRCTSCGRMAWNCRSQDPRKIYAECGQPVKSPTFLEMAASAAKAAAQFAMSRGETVSTDAHDARIAVCNACPHFSPKHSRCNQCGCFLEIKTWLPKERCPIGKW